MIIGIDATSFSHPQYGGYKTYVTNLLLALQQIPHDHTFRIFLDREVPRFDLAQLPIGSGMVITNRIPGLRQAIREQLQLPRHAIMARCQIVHYTANTAPAFAQLPYVLTLHDVIAVTEPQAPAPVSRKQIWQWAIDVYVRLIIPVAARKSRFIVTVSNFEKHQIAQHLQLPVDKIYPIHLAPSTVFQPLTDAQREQAHNRVRTMYGIDLPYVMAVGHEPRKNIVRVVRAFAELDPILRNRHGLVIVCAREHARQALQREVDIHQLNDSVRIIGGASPADLMQLYNGARAMVFPSLRESFGLPPLEAMACGTPVVASNTSSLPEVLGDAALLVTPTDTPALSAAMASILRDPALAEDLRTRGLARSQQFSWHDTARATLAVYEQAAAGRDA